MSPFILLLVSHILGDGTIAHRAERIALEEDKKARRSADYADYRRFIAYID